MLADSFRPSARLADILADSFRPSTRLAFILADSLAPSTRLNGPYRMNSDFYGLLKL